MAMIQWQGMPVVVGGLLVKYGYEPIDHLGNKRWYIALFNSVVKLECIIEVRSQAKAIQHTKELIKLLGGT